MFSHSFRSSRTFTTFVVAFAIFTDILLQNIVIPVLPYALHVRCGLDDEAEIQKWTSILSSAFGGSLMFGSCKASVDLQVSTYTRGDLIHTMSHSPF